MTGGGSLDPRITYQPRSVKIVHIKAVLCFCRLVHSFFGGFSDILGRRPVYIPSQQGCYKMLKYALYAPMKPCPAHASWSVRRLYTKCSITYQDSDCLWEHDRQLQGNGVSIAPAQSTDSRCAPGEKTDHTSLLVSSCSIRFEVFTAVMLEDLI